MELKLEDTHTFRFNTRRFDTGAAADASPLPTCSVYEEDTDIAILSPTVVKVASSTGKYRVPVAATAANGFEAGKVYNVEITATVNSVGDAQVIAVFKVAARETDDLAFPTVSGRSLDVDTSNRAAADVEAWQGFTIPGTVMVEDDGSGDGRWTQKALEKGPLGTSQGQILGLWRWSTSTAATDPGSGRVRANSGTYASITEVYIHQVDQNNFNYASVLEDLESGDHIGIAQSSNGGNFFAATLTGTPTDNGDWYTVPVSVNDFGSAIGNNQDVNVNMLFDQITAEEVADAVWDEAVAGHVAAGTFGRYANDDYSTLTAGILALSHDADLLSQIKSIISVVESQRLAHTHQVQGEIFYVDPVNGDTHANGNRGGKDDPYNSVQDCHDNAVVSSRHDLILLVAGDASGTTTLTEAVTISKRYCLIRGPGRDFVWTRSGNGDTITVTADGCELGGFQLETAATGSGAGVQATDADFLRVHHVWVNDTRGDGIALLRCDNCVISFNTFQGTGVGGSGQGIDIVGTAGSSNYNLISFNRFGNINGDAIQISGGTTNDTMILNNEVEGSTGWAIDIGASSADTVVTRNVFGNNTLGTVNDGGTDSVVTNNYPMEGLTSLSQWLGALAGKQVADATALAEIRATGAGAGTYDPVTDSQEAIRDNQSGGGGGGISANLKVEGNWGRTAGNTYNYHFWLEDEDGVVTSGVTAPTLVGVRGNGDQDLGLSGSAPTVGADNRFHGNFTLTTQPSDDVPAVLIVSVSYDPGTGSQTVRGHIRGAERS